MKRQTFEIYNQGNQPLILDQGHGVVISGAAASSFSVTRDLEDYTIAADSSEEIEIEFDPSYPGVNEAQFSLMTNDPDEQQVDISIVGNGLAPLIEITCGSEWINGINTPIPIINGDTTPFKADCTKFENVLTLGENLSGARFYVRNNGGGKLLMNDVIPIIENDPHGQFFILDGLSSEEILPGLDSRFLVRFDPTTVGYHSATIILESNDLMNPEYKFKVEGYGMSLGTVTLLNPTINVIEGEMVNFEITVDQPQNQDVLIGYLIDERDVDVNDLDVDDLTGTLTLLANTTNVQFSIGTVVDGITEGIERLNVKFWSDEKNTEELIYFTGFNSTSSKTVYLVDDMIFLNGFE